MNNKTEFTSEKLDAYFASYVGMEGGNPGASVWFCDRSPHRWLEQLVAPLEPRDTPPAWDATFRKKHQDSMRKWLSHQRIARIMAAARAEVLGLAVGSTDWKQYYDNQLYAPNGAEFRLSLFPLPMQFEGVTSWSKVFRGQPALVPRERYLDLCRYGSRFRFLTRICAKWRPKVVVCIGHRHTEDFMRAFDLEGTPGRGCQLRPADLELSLRVFERDGTAWVICPALAGPLGLNSDTMLDAFGKTLAARLHPSAFGVSVGKQMPTSGKQPARDNVEQTCAPPW